MADDIPRRGRRAPRKNASKGKNPTGKRKGATVSSRRARPKPGAVARATAEPARANLRAVTDLLNRVAAQSAGSRPAAPPLNAECKRLLDLVRQRCPDLLPPGPLDPGQATTPVPIATKDVGTLVTLAVRQAVLEAASEPVPNDADRLPSSVLWQDGPDALLVEVARIAVRVAEGVITVAIPVRCDQVTRGREVVEIDLVFGTATRPTGLLAAATEPRGPRVVVRRWGDALTALAWQAVLESIGGVAAAAGVDRDGSTLIPTALTVSASGIAVLAQARHENDRVRPGRVVASPARSGVPAP